MRYVGGGGPLRGGEPRHIASTSGVAARMIGVVPRLEGAVLLAIQRVVNRKSNTYGSALPGHPNGGHLIVGGPASSLVSITTRRLLLSRPLCELADLRAGVAGVKHVGYHPNARRSFRTGRSRPAQSPAVRARRLNRRRRRA